MASEKIKIGFIGAGGIARSHAFAISALPFYYEDAPEVSLESVCSQSVLSRSAFASRYGFRGHSSLDEFTNNENINTIYILGPNVVHVPHLEKALEMKNVSRIYIEKPVCASKEEENIIEGMTLAYPRVRFQTGFQYLFNSSFRSALKQWRSGIFGRPLHFEVRYYHGDYLRKGYRDKRKTRLAPAPEGGAMADLGSHAMSLVVAFLNENLRIAGAIQAGSFGDVVPETDLFSSVFLTDPVTGAAGTVSASRISSGTGDTLSMDIYGEKGSLRFSSNTPDYYEYYLEDSGTLNRVMTGSNYNPVTSFPSGHVPPGWLRSMIHAHYVFLIDNANELLVPDLQHGLAVQRLVRESAEHMETFRNQYGITRNS
ncbi:MAG TPA: Gfo/Idh/MocA family oxidoreductase [Bacteroidales bacterium]|nr:Gfo/Idh/MocA family oxidoreductase [Bacteroidales bacterium]